MGENGNENEDDDVRERENEDEDVRKRENEDEDVRKRENEDEDVRKRENEEGKERVPEQLAGSTGKKGEERKKSVKCVCEKRRRREKKE